MSSNIQLSNENITFPYQENGYAHKCFPVHNIRRFQPDNGGAWLVEYKTEKARQLIALDRTNNATKKKPTKVPKKVKELTGFFLTKEFHLDEPSGLFSININGKQLYSVNDEDFSLFGNVLYVEAGDNHLDFGTFKSFPRLEELHLQVNGISDINTIHTQFLCLKRLDLSYNHLSGDALLNLGKLRNIKELTLRGCSLKNLHPELARAYLVCTVDDEEKKTKGEKKSRFPELEHLDLSENKLADLSTFASLAGLRKLKTLNLSSNKICGVPNLRLLVSHKNLSASTCNRKVQQPVISPLTEENSIEKITKAKEFCEVKNSIEVVVMHSIEVASDEDNDNAKVDIAEGGNIVPNESKDAYLSDTIDIITKDENEISGVNELYDTDLPEKDMVSGSTKEDNTVHVSENEANIEDSIDMANDINLNDIYSFNSEIDEKALNEVSTVNMSPEPVRDGSASTSCKVFTPIEDCIKVEKNIDVELARENTTTNLIKTKGSSKINVPVEGNNVTVLNTTSDKDQLIGDNLQESVDVEEVSDKYAKLMNIEPLEVDDELLTTDFAKEINFTLCNSFNEDVKYMSNVSDNDNEIDSINSADDVINNNLKNPFLSLKMLDLSNNLIMEEESLLALTSWPVLQDLKLWRNPVMHAFKGVPPIISHHLQKMCGIKVHRKAPQAEHMYYPIGPSIVKSAKTFRVKNDLPPIKRNNMLMIEAEIHKAVEDNDRKEKGLLPIDAENKDEIEENEKNISNGDVEGDKEADRIFLTQVDEDFEVAKKSEESRTTNQLPEKDEEIDPTYAGYEELLKIDETYGPESDIPIPSTVYGSVQALRHMLKNPLVFKEGNYNRKSRLNPDEQKKKKRRSVPTVQKKDDIIADALDFIRTKETSCQENLATVLELFGKNSEMKENYPDAKKILKRVQEKYDKVRLESVRPISVAQAELSRMSTRADKHSQDLILLRMKQGRIGDLYSSPRTTSTPR